MNDQVFLDKLYSSFWLNQIVLLSLSMVLRWGLALSPILISTMSADNDWNCIKVNRKMIYFSFWIKSALLNCLKVGDVYLNMKTLGIKKLKRLRNQSKGTLWRRFCVVSPHFSQRTHYISYYVKNMSFFFFFLNSF